MKLKELWEAAREAPALRSKLEASIHENTALRARVAELEAREEVSNQMLANSAGQCSLRPKEQIVRAYLLVRATMDGILHGAQMAPGHESAFVSVRDTLCWILQHSHPTALGTQLAELEEFLTRNGIRFGGVVVDTDEAVKDVDISPLTNILKEERHGRESADNAQE